MNKFAFKTNLSSIVAWALLVLSILPPSIFSQIDTAASSPSRQNAIPVTANSVNVAAEDDYWNDQFGPAGVSGYGVNAIAADGDDIYIGGAELMTSGENPMHRLLRWNRITKTWQAVGANAAKNVTALAISQKAFYAAGYYFNTPNQSNLVAQWDSISQSWVPLGKSIVYNTVYALAINGEEVYVAGQFENAGGSRVNNIAKWDGVKWVALGEGIRGYRAKVFALRLKDNELFVGGDFDSAGTVAARNIAKWDGQTWSALGSGANETVFALAHEGEKLYAGGQFTSAGDVEAHGIAQWDGQTWSRLGPGLEGTVRAIAVHPNGEVYAGGAFNKAGNQEISSVAKWDGQRWSALNKGIKGTVRALCFADEELYVGGAFSRAGNVVAKDIAVWHTQKKSWAALLNGKNNGLSGVAAAFAVYKNELYAGGSFQEAGTQPVNHIARWDGQKWRSVDGGVNGPITAMKTGNDEGLYVAGNFSKAGNQDANSVAKWDGVQWQALGEGVQGSVHDLAINGNEVYAAGSFRSAGANSSSHVKRWNGQQWQDLGGALPIVDHDFAQYTIATFQNEIFVGVDRRNTSGSFLAKWNGSQWLEIAEVQVPIFVLCADRENLYVGGNFAKMGELQANGLAKWDGRNWVGLGNHDRWMIYSMFADGGNLYVGGRIPVGEMPWRGNSVAAWDGLQWMFMDLLWLPKDDGALDFSFGTIKTLSRFQGKLYVGGLFDFAGALGNERLSSNIAAWDGPLLSNNHAPIINSTLPTLSFNEDGSLLYPISKWHSRVQDQEDADSTLAFTVLSGKKVQATRQGNDYLFSAPENWFGQNKLKLIVTDRGQLADTAEFVVRVKSLNDAPRIANLPETVTFRNTASKRLAMWDFVSDVEEADSSLHFSFTASNDSLKRKFDAQTGVLILTAPGFIGKANLFLTVRDDSNAVARDTIAVQVDRTTSVAESNSEIPTEFVLLQNYPNPFNPTTLIHFGLPQASEVQLEVFDLSGQRVAVLMNEHKPAGFHAVEFNASSLSSGTYFYKLTAGSFAERKKLLLVK